MDLLLSAHADDIAYSIGGILLKGYCQQSKLVTVFEQTTFVPYITKPVTSIEQATTIRQAENIAYANKLQLEHYGMGLKDATLREYTDLDTIFTVTDYRQDSGAEESIRVIHNFLNTQTEMKRLWVPLGVGNHIDHIILQKAVLSWQTTFPLELIFYEDVPYTGFETLNSIDTWVRQVLGSTQVEIIDITYQFEEKLSNLKLYASQISSEDIERVKFHAQRIMPGFAMERIWRQVK
jgi:LmbE family N-acetylglucosaminyl deacetylase